MNGKEGGEIICPLLSVSNVSPFVSVLRNASENKVFQIHTPKDYLERARGTVSSETLP